MILMVEAGFPPVYIFGDSTMDVGTNNFFPESRARANFAHNGIDFPNSEATGRFSDGLNTADHIMRELHYGKWSPKPYLFLTNCTSSFRMNIIKGANFASGGSGILPTTGFQSYVKVVSLGEQVQQFATVVLNLIEILGPNVAATKLSQAFFLISVGSNDVFDYQVYNSSFMSANQFMQNLMPAYYNHLQKLYNLGARKFAIISIPPIGCCPAERVSNTTPGGGCIDAGNEIAQAIYSETQLLLQNLSSQLPDMKYSLGNVYKMTKEIIENPQIIDIKEVQNACCGGGPYNGRDLCNQTASLCPRRTDYLFWDLYHPTEKVAHSVAVRLYNGSKQYVNPMNFSQLALINL